MRCDECKFWFRGTRRQYKNHPIIFTSSTEEGKGVCKSGGAVNGVTVGPTFGCIDFLPFSDLSDQEEFIVYDLEQWEIWEMVPCPNCRGVGSTPNSTACDRCAGTANVRKYADGYVGDECTREHPVEKARRIERQRQELMAKMHRELAELEAGGPEPVAPTRNLSIGGGSDPV